MASFAKQIQAQLKANTQEARTRDLKAQKRNTLKGKRKQAALHVRSGHATPSVPLAVPQQAIPEAPKMPHFVSDKLPLAAATVPFGPVLKLSTNGVVVPYHQKVDIDFPTMQDHVTKVLKNNAVMALALWSLMHQCFDTTTGKVGFYFATLVNNEHAFPVVMGHWSQLLCICQQLYSCFSSRTKGEIGVRKEDLQKAFVSIIGRGLAVKDLNQMRVRTGCDATTATRVKEHSHFVISAYFWRYAARALANVAAVTDLLSETQTSNDGWCTDTRMTVYDLKEFGFAGISAFRMVKKIQSLTSAAAHFPAPHAVANFQYLDTSPSFGVPWSSEQLNELGSVRHFFSRVSTPTHFSSFFVLSDAPILTRQDIMATLKSIADDSHLRTSSVKNFARARDSETVARTLETYGLVPPGRGRPSRCSQGKTDIVRTLMEQCGAKRNRRVLKRRRPAVLGKPDEMDPSLCKKMSHVVVGVPVTPVLATVGPMIVPAIATDASLALQQAAKLEQQSHDQSRYADPSTQKELEDLFQE